MENEDYNHISDFNPNNFFISCDPANIALSQSVKILAHSTYGTMMFNEPVEDYQLGYLDDWMKISKRNSKGLSGRVRLAAEFLVSGSIIFILVEWFQLSTVLNVPFLKSVSFDLGYFYLRILNQFNLVHFR